MHALSSYGLVPSSRSTMIQSYSVRRLGTRFFRGRSMSGTPRQLPVIDSCDACGACCQVVTCPPFYRVFDTFGEDAWERLKADRPDILAEFLVDYRARRAAGGPYFGTPCIWLDAGDRPMPALRISAPGLPGI